MRVSSLMAGIFVISSCFALNASAQCRKGRLIDCQYVRSDRPVQLGASEGGNNGTGAEGSFETGTTDAPPDEVASAAEVVNEYGGRIRNIPGVKGIAVGRDDTGNVKIMVSVTEVTPALESKVPQTLGGFPVQLVKEGAIGLQ